VHVLVLMVFVNQFTVHGLKFMRVYCTMRGVRPTDKSERMRLGDVCSNHAFSGVTVIIG